MHKSKILAIFTSVFLVVAPLQPTLVYAGSNTSYSISIDHYYANGTEVLPPFDCQLNPLFNTVSVSGHGTAVNPPGNSSQYNIKLNWGDGTIENSQDNPSHVTITRTDADVDHDGKVDDFSFTFTANHNYTSNTQISIISALYHQSVQGHDGSSGDIATNPIAVCPNPEAPANLTVIKNVVNDSGTGHSVASNFSIKLSDGVDTRSDAGVANPGRVYQLASGTYTVSEDPVAGYTTSISCNNQATPTVTLSAGGSATCVVTNNDVPSVQTLTVTKIVVNNNGGTKVVSNFPLFVDGNSVVSGVQNTFSAGAHTVSETGSTGYAATFGGDCNSLGSVTLAMGDTKACTITNNDTTPTLTVIKHVINNNGGTAAAGDFTMNVTGTNVSDSSFAGSEDGTAVTLDAGAYSVDEAVFSGHTKSLSADCSGTIAVGEHKTCTITNDDQSATLTVIKEVVNNNGGTLAVPDFPLFVNGVAVTSGESNVVNAGSHTVSESGASGYTASFDENVCPGGVVTLAPGEHKTCTITNDDQSATLTVVKEVTNDNGGSLNPEDFKLFVDGNSVLSGVANVINAGLHLVSEEAVFGYEGTVGDQCASNGSVSLLPGESKMCTITNDDVAPTLTVVKVVKNDNGGTKVVADFPLFINGEAATSGEEVTLVAGGYTVTETGQSGYVGSFDENVCPGGVVTLAPGEHKTCTITNDDQPGTLTVTKIVVNDNGGTMKVSDFQLFAGGVAVTSGESNVVNADTYTVSETNKAGYVGTFGGDCDEDGVVVVSVGESKSCIITNDDTTGSISGAKFNDANGNGVRDEGEATLAGWTILLGKVGTPQEGAQTVPIEIVALSLTSVNGTFSFSGVTPGNYKVFEATQSGWVNTAPGDLVDSFFDITYRIDVPQGTALDANSFFDVFVELPGQSVTQDIHGHGLDFGNYQLLIISGEATQGVTENSVTISWNTDRPGTSRIVYDTISHPTVGSAPNYGYANSTSEADTDPKVTSHSVTITGLTPGTNYYYRVVSHGSPENVGSEGSATTSTPPPPPPPPPSDNGAGSPPSNNSGSGDNGPVVGSIPSSPAPSNPSSAPTVPSGPLSGTPPLPVPLVRTTGTAAPALAFGNGTSAERNAPETTPPPEEVTNTPTPLPPASFLANVLALGTGSNVLGSLLWLLILLILAYITYRITKRRER